MDRPTSQYCSEDAEFSLPEGVDLVGIETTRKPTAFKNRKNKSPTWKAAVKLVVINLFVCALVLGYALVGSFVFLALEGNRNSVSQVQVSASGYPVRRGSNLTLAIYNNLQGEQIQQLKSDTVRNIWEITLNMNILYPDNWTKMTSEEVGNFQRFLVERILSVVENATVEELPYSWTFPRAFLFALTTLTTIGYGGIGPKTSSAKIATMIYAIFGIPIMLWYLSNVGSLLAKIARFVCAKLCCCCCSRDNKGCSSSSSSTTSSTRKVSDPYYHIKPIEADIHRGGGGGGTSSTSLSREEHHNNHHHLHQSNLLHDLDQREHRVSILVILFLCLAILLAYVCLGSYIVTRWEKWRFLDSFYFCFLTLTTISFGDSRAQKNGLERLNQKTEWFCSFYILFGMALTSMFFNILHEEISHRFKRWKQQSSSTMDPSADPNDSAAPVNKNKRRPVENSYSVHFMNFSSPNTTASRNFTEETLLSNEIHSKRSMVDTPDKNIFDDEDVLPTDYIVSHPIPPPREIYGSHPVFPR
ncbi:unnamed protein product [Allacma fusca]|uniref:Potassium channel domain-containing protein n=1 Tax=Allacma fusca TaxID=39272 RepID=A0A8J2LFG4_9HEXA|nr:unnamed protein product [Allacma fusca]